MTCSLRSLFQASVPAQLQAPPAHSSMSIKMAHKGVTGAVRVAVRSLGASEGLRRSIDNQGLPRRSIDNQGLIRSGSAHSATSQSSCETSSCQRSTRVATHWSPATSTSVDICSLLCPLTPTADATASQQTDQGAQRQ